MEMNGPTLLSLRWPMCAFCNRMPCVLLRAIGFSLSTGRGDQVGGSLCRHYSLPLGDWCTVPWVASFGSTVCTDLR